jgi:hypothetical protein
MRAALVVLSLASLASGLFTAKAGGAAEVVDCSVCFANETLDVTELGPANDTEAEEAETKQERHSNQSTQIMVVGGLTGGFMVAAICRRPRRPRKAPSRWTQTPTQTPPPPQQQPRLRKLSTHWLAPHTYLPPSGRRKHHSVATVEQGIQTLPPPRSYEEGSQTFAVATRGPNPNPNPDPDPNPNPNPNPAPNQVATRDAMAQAEAQAERAPMETRSTQAPADLDTDLGMGVPGGPPLSNSRPHQQQPQQQRRPEQVDRASATDRAAAHSVGCSTEQLVSVEVASIQTDSLDRRSSAAQTAEVS